jgi:hypothetical protein
MVGLSDIRHRVPPLTKTGTWQLTLPALRQPPPRIALNFVRRYKWAFRLEYERLRSQVVAPDLSAFANASMEVLKDEQEPLRLHFERARDGLADLNGMLVGAAGPWHEVRLQVRPPSWPWLTQFWCLSSSRLLDPSQPSQVNLRLRCQLRSRVSPTSMLQSLTGHDYHVDGSPEFPTFRVD